MAKVHYWLKIRISRTLNFLSYLRFNRYKLVLDLITIKYEINCELLNIGFLPCYIGYYQSQETLNLCLIYVTDATGKLKAHYSVL